MGGTAGIRVGQSGMGGGKGPSAPQYTPPMPTQSAAASNLFNALAPSASLPTAPQPGLMPFTQMGAGQMAGSQSGSMQNTPLPPMPAPRMSSPKGPSASQYGPQGAALPPSQPMVSVPSAVMEQFNAQNLARQIVQERARGGGVRRLLIDQYPTKYLPDVGRQVMADGGMPELPQSPKLAATFQQENQPGVIVSPRPGKGSGRPILPEEGVPYDRGLEQDRDPWSFTTPNIAGAALPPPVYHPVYSEPRHEQLIKHTQRIFKDKRFNDFLENTVGLRDLQVKPTVGTWQGEKEPSFILQHPEMTSDHAQKLAALLGFGFQQDAAVHTTHNPDIEGNGTYAMLIGNGRPLRANHIDSIHDEAKKHGLDFTVTADGKAAKFLHFGEDADYPDFVDKVSKVADATRMGERYRARTQGDLINAQDYLPKIFGSPAGAEGVQGSPERSSDLFRGVVDHVLAPYAKAVAGEGYRLSPERLAQTYGLTPEEAGYTRGAMYPGKRGDRTTIPLMTGEEDLDVRSTGANGKATVGDVLYALQNRAALHGQIEPGDYSDAAKSKIASDIAKEVAFHVQNSDKSAIGWYDSALKKAMSRYHEQFPELATDPDKEMLFHAILGITSQGNDVYSNSTHAVRMYNLMREGASLPEALKQLRGSFGDKTRAIEQNLEKFHHLVEKNGYDKMRDMFNQTKTVSEWDKTLRGDKDLYGPNGKPLEMKGGKNQKVTGWMVFGPKIGSFINNLHGDYSTLTADLWFSRTWNRLLGYNFIHTPMSEAKQYRDFRDALRAEHAYHNGALHEQPIGKTSDGQLKVDTQGNPIPWAYGNDMVGIPYDEMENLVNDPDRMLSFAQDLEKKYRMGGYKDKSDLRRRAKNWIENRELPQAAPRSDNERSFQQDTVEAAQRLLKKKYGMNISVADIQAALWFHEKELFGKLGVASEKAQPADYADAAERTMQAVRSGDLYTVKSRQKKADGGPVEMGDEDMHPARSIPGFHLREEEHGQPIFVHEDDRHG